MAPKTEYSVRKVFDPSTMGMREELVPVGTVEDNTDDETAAPAEPKKAAAKKPATKQATEKSKVLEDYHKALPKAPKRRRKNKTKGA